MGRQDQVRRRRFLHQTASLASGAALGLAGCGAGETRTPLRLMVASYDKSVGASIGDQWAGVVKAFEKKHPSIQVTVEHVPFEKLDATLARRVRDGKAPDIAQSNLFASYAANDLLYAASDIFDIATESDFTLSLAQAGKVHRVQYGIPLMASTPRLFYNTALFEKAGVDSPPRTWAELRAAAQALQSSGVPTPYGLQFGPEAAEDELYSWLLAGEGDYTTSSGYDFYSDPNVATLTWLRDELVGPGLAGADPAKLSRTAAYEQFLGGRIGMMLAHPVLMDAADGLKVPYAHAAFPARRGGAAVPVGINDWLLAFRQNGRRAACAAFLGFVYGKESEASYGGGGAAALPVTETGAEAVAAKGDRLNKFIGQLPRARFQPTSMRSWSTVRREIRTEIGRAVRRDGDPDAILRSLQAGATRSEAQARS
ncbi:ABC transporter substrate-binding protein [Streptomyces cavernicola]|uniref:Extracellular solute-binding protein n=1 Tax=Streptomyces cavernicola TaxID=3043613 RepID=A0ABT6SA46_9ACTN|nr:extracellular solute-binding protein [Streptomyces sp. B-S-A6]MDI3405065.1 extracellular solute-binding protein [Streptomyces sp. B-S-A6]